MPRCLHSCSFDCEHCPVASGRGMNLSVWEDGMRFRMARLMAAAVCVVTTLAFATPSAAQVSTGRIDASVVDSTGAVLPGVTVDISGPQNHTSVSDPLGEVHFLNLAPGTYTVSAKLSGF